MNQDRDYSMFVGDLSYEVDNTILLDAFSAKFPSVTSAKVILDTAGGSRGFGFVKFSDPYEFEKALVEMQNVQVGSRNIRVNHATRKTQQQNSYQPSSGGRGGGRRPNNYSQNSYGQQSNYPSSYSYY